MLQVKKDISSCEVWVVNLNKRYWGLDLFSNVKCDGEVDGSYKMKRHEC